MKAETTSRGLNVGTVLKNGMYIIKNVLGYGGFGITYLAEHVESEKEYAVKEFFLSGYNVRNSTNNTIQLQGVTTKVFNKYRKKFIEEAQTLEALNHPNIVKVKEVFSENNTAYIVMPFIQGNTLYEEVRTTGAMSAEEAINYIAQISEAIGYVHTKDILHRDIKPENIMITPDKKAIVIDFGSAREFIQGETQQHTTIMTQGYAPIEQYSTSGKKGYYSDIYSIGAVFYFMVTALVPLEAVERLNQDMKSPRSVVPNLSPEINNFILKCMEIQPEHRFQDIPSLLKELLGDTVEAQEKQKWFQKPLVFFSSIIVLLFVLGVALLYILNLKGELDNMHSITYDHAKLEMEYSELLEQNKEYVSTLSEISKVLPILIEEVTYCYIDNKGIPRTEYGKELQSINNWQLRAKINFVQVSAQATKALDIKLENPNNQVIYDYENNQPALKFHTIPGDEGLYMDGLKGSSPLIKGKYTLTIFSEKVLVKTSYFTVN